MKQGRKEGRGEGNKYIIKNQEGIVTNQAWNLADLGSNPCLGTYQLGL